MAFFRTCLVLALAAGAAALTPQEEAAMQAAKDIYDKLAAAQQRETRASSSGPTVSAVGGSLKLSTGNDVQISVGGEEVVKITSTGATDTVKAAITQTLGAAKFTVSGKFPRASQQHP
jgi:hypothetical protein